MKHQVGAIPEGLVLRHKCDTPACVNPAHLDTGTQKDNSRDCKERGRMVPPPVQRGTANVNARLTPAQAIEIRRRRALGEKLAPLAREFGVNQSTISRVALGRVWSWT